MKLKIPAANSLLKKKKSPPKNPTIERVVMEWLNNEVYNEIILAEPQLNKSFEAEGEAYVEVPWDYSNDPNKFKMLTIAQLVPLGYKVEFTYDGCGMGRDTCIIKWTYNI